MAICHPFFKNPCKFRLIPRGRSRTWSARDQEKNTVDELKKSDDHVIDVLDVIETEELFAHSDFFFGSKIISTHDLNGLLLSLFLGLKNDNRHNEWDGVEE